MPRDCNGTARRRGIPSVSTSGCSLAVRRRADAARAGPQRGSVVGGTLAPADAGGDEAVQVAVEHRGGVVHLVVGAQVLDHLVRREHVRAHLVAPARGDDAGEVLLDRRFLLLLEDQQARLQHAHGGGAVLDLRLLVLHRHDGAGRKVGEAHGGVGRVDRLAAGAGRAEHVDAEVVLGDLDLDGLVQQRDDLDRGEARSAACRRS